MDNRLLHFIVHVFLWISVVSLIACDSKKNPDQRKYESSYNTYKLEGLTPGPICNPGLDAIMAAVNPDDTDYYYFCHKAPTEDEGAVPYYAKTNYEHLANQEAAGLL